MSLDVKDHPEDYCPRCGGHVSVVDAVWRNGDEVLLFECDDCGCQVWP